MLSTRLSSDWKPRVSMGVGFNCSGPGCGRRRPAGVGAAGGGGRASLGGNAAAQPAREASKHRMERT